RSSSPQQQIRTSPAPSSKLTAEPGWYPYQSTDLRFRGHHLAIGLPVADLGHPIVLSVDTASPDVVRDSLWRTLQIVTDWIKVADTKAGAALAVDGVMLAIFTARLRSTPAASTISTAGLLIAIALAAASALFAVWTVVPRARRLQANSMVH